jgi:SulP family sulfate permease
MMDMTAMVALESLLQDLHSKNIAIVINHLAPRLLLKMRRAGLRYRKGSIEFARDMPASAALALQLLERHGAAAV